MCFDGYDSPDSSKVSNEIFDWCWIEARDQNESCRNALLVQNLRCGDSFIGHAAHCDKQYVTSVAQDLRAPKLK